MYSIRELYRIGRGPSSSHTMGPARAAGIFRQRYPRSHSFRIHFQGSLAATGKGHLTDLAVRQSLAPLEVSFVWQPEVTPAFHPNGMRLEALDSAGNVIGDWEVFSTGGGALQESTPSGWLVQPQPMYEDAGMNAILKKCTRSGQALWEYVEDQEGAGLWDFLGEIWQAMQAAIERGLLAEGVLPGGLGLARKAWVFHRQTSISGRNFLNEGLLPAYALAVAEENASGNVVVTAPTCGSSGVLPAVLRHVQENTGCSDRAILRALATAGLLGNLIRHNASISGAEVGCQGEIGAACAMAAGAAASSWVGLPARSNMRRKWGWSITWA